MSFLVSRGRGRRFLASIRRSGALTSIPSGRPWWIRFTLKTTIYISGWPGPLCTFPARADNHHLLGVLLRGLLFIRLRRFGRGRWGRFPVVRGEGRGWRIFIRGGWWCGERIRRQPVCVVRWRLVNKRGLAGGCPSIACLFSRGWREQLTGKSIEQAGLHRCPWSSDLYFRGYRLAWT